LNPRYICITTPSIAVLEQRLTGRLARAKAEEGGSQTSSAPSSPDKSDVSQWIDKAQHEGKRFSYDFAVINNDLEQAFTELRDYCLSVYWKDFDQEQGSE
jgi:hypothetical protein